MTTPDNIRNIFAKNDAKHGVGKYKEVQEDKKAQAEQRLQEIQNEAVTKRSDDGIGSLSLPSFGQTVGAMAVAAFLYVGFFYIPPTEKEDAATMCRSETMAFTMAKSIIEKRLVSPATADFPWYIDEFSKSTAEDSCRFFVSSYVDSQNSFGALIRTKFTMNIEYNPETQMWVGTNIQTR